MKYLIFPSVFLSFSLFSMDHEKTIMVVTTTTSSRSTSERVSVTQAALEEYQLKCNKHENCCTITARLLSNLPMALASLPVVWVDDALNTIQKKLKVD